MVKLLENSFLLLQSVAFRISPVVIPEVAAAEVLALCTQWALNISVSTPTLFSKVLSHLAIVDEDRGL